MSQPLDPELPSRLERIRAWLRHRGLALFLALALEGLLGLLLLTLSPSFKGRDEQDALTVFNMDAPATEEAAEKAEAEVQEKEFAQKPAEPEVQPDQPDPQPAPPQPNLPPPSMIQMNRDQMAALDIMRAPSARPTESRRPATMGPPSSGVPGDSQRVDGTGPNGEPLYAASWYREPTEEELAGYLSTASGPGWGLIACRTVPDFRVEDCVPLAEYPEGSKMNRAILAAAWQFRVRPPRVGGRLKIGEWVRIRIDYQMRYQAR